MRVSLGGSGAADTRAGKTIDDLVELEPLVTPVVEHIAERVAIFTDSLLPVWLHADWE